MNKADIKEFTSFLMAIAEVYGRKLTEAAIMIYFDALKDLDFTAIKGAVKAHCQNPTDGKFFPLIANIRSYICKPEKDSVIAWRQVEDAYCQFNYYDTVQFEDQTINAVLHDMGGWTWFSSQNLDEPWTQKEFERRYNSYKAQRIHLDEPLMGFHAAHNYNNGYLDMIPPVKFIAENGEVLLLPYGIPKKELPEHDKAIKLLADKMEMSKS